MGLYHSIVVTYSSFPLIEYAPALDLLHNDYIKLPVMLSNHRLSATVFDFSNYEASGASRNNPVTSSKSSPYKPHWEIVRLLQTVVLNPWVVLEDLFQSWLS